MPCSSSIRCRLRLVDILGELMSTHLERQGGSEREPKRAGTKRPRRPCCHGAPALRMCKLLLRLVAEIFRRWKPLTSWMREIEDLPTRADSDRVDRHGGAADWRLVRSRQQL